MSIDQIGRRRFLLSGPATLAAALTACRTGTRSPGQAPPSSSATPGAPPAFNTAAAVGPTVSPATFEEAGKLAQFAMTETERVQAAGSWRTSMAGLLERRTGPRTIALEPMLAPATVWDPATVDGAVRLKANTTYDTASVVSGLSRTGGADRFVRTDSDPGPLPSSDADIAFAPVARLSRWIETRKLTSARLTGIYLDRIQRWLS